MNKQIETVLKKEMTRKEFMATMGFGIVSLMGFGSVLSFLRGNHASSTAAKKQSSGYGSSSYGN